MSGPEISVVMAVRNGADTLRETLESVLIQDDCDFEFIVVDDGSTDASARILDDRAAQDSRLRVVHQENAGLTRALIRACGQAQGEFIARQDGGDVSLPTRLAKQAQRLKNDDGCVAVSSHTEFIGPRGEYLFKTEIGEQALNQSLSGSNSEVLAGPAHHGSMMMRRSAYEAVGGYRDAFYFAQDIDLWTRLIERGRFAVVPEVLYRARLDADSISATQTGEQRRLAHIIAQARAARRGGNDESPWLAEAATIQPAPDLERGRRMAQGNYFIGSCLRRRAAGAAAHYFRAAMRQDPAHWRAWVRFVECKLRAVLGTGSQL
jgi:GT2 family glycosyltransferase